MVLEAHHRRRGPGLQLPHIDPTDPSCLRDEGFPVRGPGSLSLWVPIRFQHTRPNGDNSSGEAFNSLVPTAWVSAGANAIVANCLQLVESGIPRWVAHFPPLVTVPRAIHVLSQASDVGLRSFGLSILQAAFVTSGVPSDVFSRRAARRCSMQLAKAKLQSCRAAEPQKVEGTRAIWGGNLGPRSPGGYDSGPLGTSAQSPVTGTWDLAETARGLPS